MSPIEKVRESVLPVVEGEGLMLYDLAYRTENGQKALQVMICRPDYSMDLDTCERMSEKISAALDQAGLLRDAYVLDVCSPGAERELKTDQEIRGAIGKYVHIELKNPREGIDRLEGILKEAAAEEVLLEYKVKTRTKEFRVRRDNLKKIRLAIQF